MSAPRPEARPARVHAYIRVSGHEQALHGHSLDDQEARLVAYCASRGWPPPLVYTEQESGGAGPEKRDDLRRLLNAVRPGDQVIVTMLDRWSRDIPFAVRSVRDLVAMRVGWLAVDEGLDATTPAGDDQLGGIAWGADRERKRLRERMVGTRKRLRDRGLYVEGLVPLGYRRGDDDATRNILRIVEDEAALVRLIYAMCIAGASLTMIVEELEERHPGRKWERKALNTMLRNRVYLGEIRGSDGVWRPGRHQAIIDEDTFARAGASLDARRHVHGRTPAVEAKAATLLLRGAANCASCGARVGYAYSRVRPYYACARRLRGGCTAPYQRADVADERVATLVLEHLANLREDVSRPRRGLAAVADQAALERRRADLALRRERTAELYIDGRVSKEHMERMLAKLDSDDAKLAAKLQAAQEAAASRSPEHQRRLLAQTTNLQKAWRRLDTTGRRKILMLLASEIVLDLDHPDEQPRITWRPLDELLQDQSDDWYRRIVGAEFYDATIRMRKRRGSC